jgi:hypothetical protein
VSGEYGFMPKKKTTNALSKLTEVEQDLLAQLAHGYGSRLTRWAVTRSCAG